jgi:hypothetical protein
LTIILHGLHLLNEIRTKVHAADHSAARVIRRGSDHFGKAGSETDGDAQETPAVQFGAREAVGLNRRQQQRGRGEFGVARPCSRLQFSRDFDGDPIERRFGGTAHLGASILFIMPKITH